MLTLCALDRFALVRLISWANPIVRMSFYPVPLLNTTDLASLVLKQFDEKYGELSGVQITAAAEGMPPNSDEDGILAPDKVNPWQLSQTHFDYPRGESLLDLLGFATSVEQQQKALETARKHPRRVCLAYALAEQQLNFRVAEPQSGHRASVLAFAYGV